MVELTLLLVVVAGAVFFLFKDRRKASVNKAADAARKAVEGRTQRDRREDG